MGKNKFSDNKITIIHGILAIVFGVIVVSYPGLTVSLLATFFGLLLLIVGVILSLGAYLNKDLKKTGPQNFIFGILSIVLSIVILSYPKESIAAFLILSVGIWAIITGAILIWAYTQNSGDAKRRPVTLAFGIASIIFGIFMAVNPIEGTYGIATLVGIYAIIFGTHTIYTFFKKNS